MKRLLFLCIFLSNIASAHTLKGPLGIDTVSVAYGSGLYHNLQLARANVRWDWNYSVFNKLPFILTGAWELSYNQIWTDQGKARNKTIANFAAAPVFRLLLNKKHVAIFRPYLEISVGPSIHTASVIGTRRLGAMFAFQDSVGGGVIIGEGQHFALSYHWMHWSNADTYKPNNGITINHSISASYYF